RRAAYQELLEKKHYWVVAASTPDEAIALAKKQLFHVCVWAVDASNLNAMRDLKTLRPWSLVVAISAVNEPALIVESVRSGASDFWLRNEDVGELCLRVERLLAQTNPESDDE